MSQERAGIPPSTKEYPEDHINEILDCVEYVENPVVKARMIHLAIETMILKQKERITTLETTLSMARDYLVSCPWCGEKMEGRAVSRQIQHLMAHGDSYKERASTQEAALREYGVHQEPCRSEAQEAMTNDREPRCVCGFDIALTQTEETPDD